MTEVEPGRVFGFAVVTAIFEVQTRWRYEVVPANGGTLLKESFEVLWLFPGVVQIFFKGKNSRQHQLDDNVRLTLSRIKDTVEAVAM